MKTVIKWYVHTMQKILYFFTGADDISGFLVLLSHWTFVSFCGFYSVFGPMGFMWWIIVGISFIFMVSNYIFRGCLFLKLERHLFHDKNWYGVWNAGLGKAYDISDINTAYWRGIDIGTSIIIWRGTNQILYWVVYINKLLYAVGQRLFDAIVNTKKDSCCN